MVTQNQVPHVQTFFFLFQKKLLEVMYDAYFLFFLLKGEGAVYDFEEISLKFRQTVFVTNICNRIAKISGPILG